MATITVIGGGLAGLVAAIECAGHGADVVVREAAPTLGGRARSRNDRGFTANQGPHALYADGQAWAWLEQHGLQPATCAPGLAGYRIRHNGELGRGPGPLLDAIRALRAPAPGDVSFRTWARSRAGEAAAEAAIGYLALPLYDADPGRYSARFVNEIFARTTVTGSVRYVIGGWSVLVSMLALHARQLGVQIQTRDKVTRLPDPPVIVATAPAAAAKLLDDKTMVPPRRKVALLDLGVRRSGYPAAVLDVDHRVYAARYSSTDPSLAPVGHDLIQCCSGLHPREQPAQAIGRIEQVLDAAFPGWRRDITYYRAKIMASPGAVDLPGSSWHDRPPVRYSDGVLLAGDYVAAPGLLAEISFNSARQAAEAAITVATTASQLISAAR